MPLPLTVSCSSKIQIGFTFLVPAYPGCPGKEAVKWLLLLLLTKNIAYHTMEMLIFYAVYKVLVMGHSGTSRLFHFALVLKSRKLDAHEIFTFYGT